MQIEMAHVQIQGINVAVFDADAQTHNDHDRADLLADLTVRAQRNNLRVEKSVLVYREFGQIRFFGTPDLVQFLVGQHVVPRMTHTLDV